MYTDVPLLKRCCFCVPLRYGLITLGYLGMVASLFAMAQWVSLHVSTNYQIVVTIYPWLVYNLTAGYIDQIFNFAFSITLVIASHMKNVKLLKICLYACIVGPTLELLLMAPADIYFLWRAHTYTKRIWKPLLMYGAETLAAIIIKVYLAFLIRSEIRKLKNNCLVSFVNMESDAEAKCTMISCVEESDLQNDHYVVEIGTTD